MAKKKKSKIKKSKIKGKKKSLSRSRSKRKFQKGALEKRIQKRQEQAGRRGKNVIKGGLDIPIWRPGDGQHIIDIIPYAAGKNDPEVSKGDPTYTFEYWVHQGVGPSNDWMLCIQDTYGQECPICEERTRLRDKDKEYTHLFPKRRNLYNIICYDAGEETKGVQVFDISYHYFEKFIMALSQKASRGRTKKKKKTINFADEEVGKSIEFTVEPAKTKEDYPKFIGHSFDDRDYEIEEDILDSVFTLDEIVHIPKYDEMESAFFGSKGSKKRRRDEDEDEGDDYDAMMSEAEELEDLDEMKDFIEEYDIDLKIKKRDDEDDVREKIMSAIQYMQEEEEEEYDEDEEEEEEDDEYGDEPEYTAKQIRKMKKKKLKKLIEEEDLDVDPDDAEDLEELQDMVMEELEIEED